MTAPVFETLLWSREASFAHITINRPKVLNALNVQVIHELLAILNNSELTHGLRALVLSGAGDKAFVAGADIAAMQKLSTAGALEFARLGQNLTLKLEAAPYLTIAKVQGYALGGGCELAMACDLVVASDKALFGQPEVDLGILPGFGGTQRLARRVGLPLALDILCAGRKLNGLEAQQLGLVTTVASAEELDATVAKILKNIARAAPLAIAETKRLARASLDMPLDHGLAAEATAFAACFSGSEAQEGLAAFLEKRKATFSS
ncbi:MAG: enoyl-CoA hydratase-related protein [Proteobacteria bacterium]|nr:enoyl-CoA hydratase-related protein [Pseudomonadota bacterium]